LVNFIKRIDNPLMTTQEIPAEFIDEDTGAVIYPESDGKPMAESTTHFKWITMIESNLSGSSFC
jgi:hypothetical protein